MMLTKGTAYTVTVGPYIADGSGSNTGPNGWGGYSNGGNSLISGTEINNIYLYCNRWRWWVAGAKANGTNFTHRVGTASGFYFAMDDTNDNLVHGRHFGSSVDTFSTNNSEQTMESLCSFSSLNRSNQR